MVVRLVCSVRVQLQQAPARRSPRRPMQSPGAIEPLPWRSPRHAIVDCVHASPSSHTAPERQLPVRVPPTGSPPRSRLVHDAMFLLPQHAPSHTVASMARKTGSPAPFFASCGVSYPCTCTSYRTTCQELRPYVMLQNPPGPALLLPYIRAPPCPASDLLSDVTRQLIYAPYFIPFLHLLLIPPNT